MQKRKGTYFCWVLCFSFKSVIYPSLSSRVFQEATSFSLWCCSGIRVALWDIVNATDLRKSLPITKWKKNPPGSLTCKTWVTISPIRTAVHVDFHSQDNNAQLRGVFWESGKRWFWARLAKLKKRVFHAETSFAITVHPGRMCSECLRIFWRWTANSCAEHCAPISHFHLARKKNVKVSWRLIFGRTFQFFANNPRWTKQNMNVAKMWYADILNGIEFWKDNLQAKDDVRS